MLKPLAQWCCDSCGQLIDRPEMGCVEWHTAHRTNTTAGFRIVHKTDRCRYQALDLVNAGRTCIHVPLSEAIDPPGLGRLLARIEEAITSGSVSPEALGEFIEVLRRVQIPYYEEARVAWEAGIKEGIHDGTRYDAATLKRILHWKDAAIAAWVASITGEDAVPRVYAMETS